jgi:omega-hydroxy-beta-dihydromenaquinone-9 sulfotransferase
MALEIEDHRSVREGGAWIDDARALLTEHLLHPLLGVTSGTWWRLLRRHGFRVDVPYWPRALLLTATSLVNSLAAGWEDVIYGRAVANARIEPPLFVLGHYRSGTTFLYRLLAQDPQFAHPNYYQAYFPSTFLCTEAFIAPLAALFLARRRLQDGLALSVRVPADDESALCTATLLSPYMCQAFPRDGVDYARYLTFRGVPEDEVAAWKEALMIFMRKLSYKYKLPIVLKSPTHTARVRLLLDIFPDARFIHIHRDPYTVFQSTKRLMESLAAAWTFQNIKINYNFEYILCNYKLMYNEFFESRHLIPRGQFHEIGFEELEADPVGVVGSCYEALRLPGFGTARGPLRDYLASIAGYKKAAHPAVPEPLRGRIAREWGRCFEEWGYAV